MVAPGRGRWLIGLALVAGVLVAPVAPSGADEVRSTIGRRCLSDVVPVALGPGRPADQRIAPKIIEMDEDTKETFTRDDGRTFPPVMGESDGITAPVLDAIGEYDAWFCAGKPCSAPDGTTSGSRQWYDATSCFEQYVLPEAGHDINVHFTSRQWFAAAAEWTQRMVAGSGPCRAPAG
jgi:hypothetical protein